MHTSNFHVYGNATASKVKEVAVGLERLRAALERMKGDGAARSPVPMAVFVFRSPEELARYLPRRDGKPLHAAAYFQESQDGSYIALSAPGNSDPRAIVNHEYLHQFMRANYPPEPAWYEEGVSEFYSTFRTEADEAQIGRVRDDHLDTLRTRMIPVERLLAVDHDSPEYNDPGKQGVFYAESWALVHYLMGGDAARMEQLGRYLALLQIGTPVLEAFPEAFGEEPQVLESELVSYIRNKRFPFDRIRFSELRVPQEATVEAMPYEEAVFRLGDLLAHGPDDRFDEAERYFQAVIAARPTHAGALGGLAQIRVREGRPADAASLFRRAAETGSADFRVYFHDGQLRMEELVMRPNTSVLDSGARMSLDAARAAFRKSIALDPDFAEARVALGRTYLVEEGPAAEEGVAALEEARRRLPMREDIVMDLVELYESRGERAKSDELAARVGPAASLALARRRQPSVIEVTVAEVNRLLEDEREEEALDLMNRFIDRIGQEEVREEMEAQRHALRKSIAKNRAVKDYNDAIALYNGRDYSRALAAFEKLAADSANPEVARNAEGRVRDLRAMTMPGKVTRGKR